MCLCKWKTKMSWHWNLDTLFNLYCITMFTKSPLHLYHADIIGTIADSQCDSITVMTSHKRHKFSFLQRRHATADDGSGWQQQLEQITSTLIHQTIFECLHHTSTCHSQCFNIHNQNNGVKLLPVCGKTKKFTLDVLDFLIIAMVLLLYHNTWYTTIWDCFNYKIT